MVGSDVRYAWRALVRQRGATALVVLMLGLGIAANVAVFSLVNGLFLRPFPFPNPDRLVFINTAAPKWNLEYVGINYPDFDCWHKDQKLFDAIATYESSNFNLAHSSGAERVSGLEITYDFFKVLAVEPLLGRSFTPEEDKPKAAPVVILGEALWKERFGADRDVVGRSVRLDGTARTIVGVMPHAASFPDDVRLWVPRAGSPVQAVSELLRKRHRADETRADARTGRRRDQARAPADLGRVRQGPHRHAIRAAAARPVRSRLPWRGEDRRRGRRGPSAHCVRQRRGGDARACAGATPRNGHPPRPRIEPRAAAAAVADREPHARRRGRRARTAGGTLGGRAADHPDP